MDKLQKLQKAIFDEDMKFERYLELDFLSSSRIRNYHKFPEMYYNKTPEEIAKNESISSPALTIGNLLHKAIDNPISFKINEKMYMECLTKSEQSMFKEILGGVRKNVTFKNMVKDTLYKEKTLLFTLDVKNRKDPKKSKKVVCKARIDMLTKSGYLIDYKTTRRSMTERSIRSVINEYRYDVQMAFYKEALRQNGIEVNEVNLMFSEKTKPYLTHFFTLSDYYLERGREGSSPYDGYEAILEEMIFYPKKNRFGYTESTILDLE